MRILRSVWRPRDNASRQPTCLARRAPVLPLALLLLLAACQADGRSWPRCWFNASAHHSFTQPIIRGDTAIVGSDPAQIFAFNVRTGDQYFNVALSSNQAVLGRQFIWTRGVLVAEEEIETVGIDLASHRVLWRYSAPVDTTDVEGLAQAGQVSSVAADADSTTVFVPAWGASVSALDLRTGQVRWIWQIGRLPSDTESNLFRSGANAVRVSGDTVYVIGWHSLGRFVVASEGFVFALDKATGRELWRLLIPTDYGGTLFWGVPVLYSNLLIFSEMPGRALAVDRSTGRIVWHFLPAATHSNKHGVALYDGIIYNDGADDMLYGLDAQSGQVIRKIPLPVAGLADFVVYDHYILYPSYYQVSVYDRQSGRLVATVPEVPNSDTDVPAAPAYTDGRLVAMFFHGTACYRDPRW